MVAIDSYAMYINFKTMLPSITLLNYCINVAFKQPWRIDVVAY